MSNYTTVREHIENYWIGEVGDLVEKHAFMSFGVIGAGIEFLGKCLDYHSPWHSSARTSKWHFEFAIRKLSALHKYRDFIGPKRIIKCTDIGKNLEQAAQINGDDSIMSEIERVQSIVKAFNSAVRSNNRTPRAFSNNEVRDFFERDRGELSRAYFDNNENENLGKAIDIFKKMQANFESSNDMHPTSVDLYAELRCGMVHAGLPGLHRFVTSATGKHIYEKRDGNGHIAYWVLDAKALYDDFKAACLEVIDIQDPHVVEHIKKPLLYFS